MTERKVCLFIAMTLDGYIASKNDDISFLDPMHIEGEDYGYAEFTKDVDTYIIGRKTYDVIKNLQKGEFPQADKYDCYVITRQERAAEKGITFYQGEVAALIHQLKSQPGKNIYCDGGAEIIRLLLQENLIDEFTVSIIPTLLGEGKHLFLPNETLQQLTLVESKTYSTGLVKLKYIKASS